MAVGSAVIKGLLTANTIRSKVIMSQQMQLGILTSEDLTADTITGNSAALTHLLTDSCDSISGSVDTLENGCLSCTPSCNSK